MSEFAASTETAPTPDFDAVLRETFGLERFRIGQREAIEALWTERRLVCIQPTGHGKSLLYQLPAVLLEGMTLVVSPLLALMRDQVGQLGDRFGVAAGAINSDQSDEENAAVMTAASQGRLRILFVAPERLDHLATYEFLTELPIDLFVVDEAHCISTWGHDFRPAYRQIMHAVHALSERRSELRVLGLTATANQRTEADILAQFGGERAAPAVHRHAMDRSNLHLRVLKVKGLDDKLAVLEPLFDDLASNDAGERQSGVLYCATREQTEIVAGYLSSVDRPVVAYHAGLPPHEKRRLQEAFLSGEVPVIAATNALGMGIDKSNLRFIVHVDVPGSITAYYQEVGRAGRDGAPATGVLLFDESDRDVQEYFIHSAQPSVEEFAKVLDAIPFDGPHAEEMAPGRTQVGVATGLHPTKVTVILAELIEQGHLAKRLIGRRQAYVRTDRRDAPDLSRYARQYEVRTAELAAMLDYGRSEGTCLMETLRLALGDDDATACGRCSGCQPDAFPAIEIDESQRAAARRWVTHRELPIPATRVPVMDAGVALLDGQIRSPIFVGFMRGRTEDGDLAPDLWELFDAAIDRLHEEHRFGAAVIVPSRTWRQREAVAQRIEERLGIPVRAEILEWDPMPEARQGELRNNDQRRENVKGKLQFVPSLSANVPPAPILLVDDYYGSGATLKEAVRALRKSGGVKATIVPLMLARVRWRLGSAGMI